MPNTKIIGRVELPDGTTPANAYVRFIMSGFDTDAPDSATIIPRPIDAVIDESGNIDVELWPNQDGVRLTYYRASVVVRNPHSNDDTYKLDVLAVPSEGGPYDLNVLLAESPPDGADVDQYIARLAAAVASAEDAADRAENAASESGVSLFNRKLHLDLPFHPQSIIDAEIQKGAATPGLSPLVYVQYVCADEENDELFVWHTLTSSAYVAVYDFNTGVEKTSFAVTGQGGGRESLTYRKVGSTRYLYGVSNPAGSVWRVDITTLPASGSSFSPSGADLFTFANASDAPFSRLEWIPQAGSADGGFFIGLSSSNVKPSGSVAKTDYNMYDVDFNIIGEVTFPVGAVGSYVGDYLDNMPKGQSNCFHNGSFYHGIGGDYRLSANAARPTQQVDMAKKQGVIKCSSTGEVVDTALAHPQFSLEQFEVMTGRTLDVLENEGIFAAYGKVWALWQTTGPAEWDGDALNYGIVITEEMSADPDAVDFSEGACLVEHPIDQRAGLGHRASLSQLIDPVIGTPLTSFNAIIDMMRGLNMESYSFYGTGQTLTDINGDTVSISGAMVTFKMPSPFGCSIDIEGARSSTRYWVHTISGTRGQIDPVSSFDSAGALLVDFDESDATTGTKGHILHEYGRAAHITENTHALELQRTGSVGFLGAFFSTARDLIGGIYQHASRVGFRFNSSAEFTGGSGSPEGIVSGVTGSQWNRTDGTGGIYLKSTPTGNTGWVLVGGASQVDTTRAAMASLIAGGYVPDHGVSYILDGYLYVGDTRAVDIPDLAGLVPTGDATPQHFGALGNADRFGANGVMSSGSTTFTAAGNPFSSDDIGKIIRIDGAGVSGSKHVAHITGYTDANNVEIDVAAVTTVTGAIWTFGHDDTDAFDLLFAWIENDGVTGKGYLSSTLRSIMGPTSTRNALVPSGNYLYNGTGYNPSGEMGRAINIRGAGRNNVSIEILSDSWLIHRLATSVSAESSVDITNLSVYGGKGLYMNEKNTGVPQAYHKFDNLQIGDFSSIAIGSLAAGVPRWQITNSWIETAFPDTKGVMFNEEFANPDMSGTTIVGCRYKIVTPSAGTGGGFFRGLTMFNSSDSAGIAEADFWFRTGAASIQGRFMRVTGCRFSNENRSGKPWFLIADYDDTTGDGVNDFTFNHLTSKPVTRPYFRDLIINDNHLSGSGTPDDGGAVAGNMLETYTGQVGALRIEQNDISTAYTHLVFFHNAPDVGYASDTTIGPNFFPSKGEAPKFCNLNIGRWYWRDAEIPTVQTDLPSRGGWDINEAVLSVDASGDKVTSSDWTYSGSASGAVTSGPFGGGTARTITFTSDSEYLSIPISGIGSLAAGQNIFVEFDVSGVGARSLGELDVVVTLTTASGSEVIRHPIIPRDVFLFNRIAVQANEAITGLSVRFYPSPDGFTAGVFDRVNIDNVTVYAANHPVNTGHIQTQNAGWNSAHIKLDEGGGQKSLRVFPDYTADVLRQSMGPPSGETDGVALLGSVINSSGGLESFTPVVVGSGSDGAGTYTANEGRYSTLGSFVFGFVRVVWTGHTGAGNLQIDLGALDPTRNSPVSRGFFVPYTTSGFNLSGSTHLAGYVVHGTNTVQITARGSTGETSVPMQSSGQIYGFFAYEAG